MRTKTLGDIGEAIAQRYLKQKGYKILQTNFRCKLGEIDIIAKDKNIIVFVEVKTRTLKKFGLPREAVNEYKQQKIRNVASLYLQKTNGFDNFCRFDVIEIIDADNITHIQNAF